MLVSTELIGFRSAISDVSSVKCSKKPKSLGKTLFQDLPPSCMIYYLMLLSLISRIFTTDPNSSQTKLGMKESFSWARESRPTFESSCAASASTEYPIRLTFSDQLLSYIKFYWPNKMFPKFVMSLVRISEYNKSFNKLGRVFWVTSSATPGTTTGSSSGGGSRHNSKMLLLKTTFLGCWLEYFLVVEKRCYNKTMNVIVKLRFCRQTKRHFVLLKPSHYQHKTLTTTI